jgi:hypothetical protein
MLLLSLSYSLGMFIMQGGHGELKTNVYDVFFLVSSACNMHSKGRVACLLLIWVSFRCVYSGVAKIFQFTLDVCLSIHQSFCK